MKVIVLQSVALVSLTVLAPNAFAVSDLTIIKTHTGIFTAGQSGAYTLTVSNAGADPTSGAVTVTDTLPTGLTLADVVTGNDWSCITSTATQLDCTSSAVVGAAGSFSLITLNVNIASNAPSSVTNTATVSGGGETNTSNDTSSDQTTIVPTTPVRLQSFDVD